MLRFDAIVVLIVGGLVWYSMSDNANVARTDGPMLAYKFDCQV